MHRTDYDFDVISGPSTQAPAPQALFPSATPPRSSGAAPAPAPAPAPARPAEEAAGGGDKG